MTARLTHKELSGVRPDRIALDDAAACSQGVASAAAAAVIEAGQLN